MHDIQTYSNILFNELDKDSETKKSSLKQWTNSKDTHDLGLERVP